MRTAFCFSGELRTLDRTIKLIETNVFSKFSDYDIFCFTWEDDPDIDKIEYLKNTGRLIKFKTEPRKTFDEDIIFPKKVMPIVYQGIPRQLYGVQQSNILKYEHEINENFTYDIVVRIRPDLLILNESELEDDIEQYDLAKIYTLSHDEWHGVCDRFYISNSKNANLLSNNIDYLPYYSTIGGKGYGEEYLLFMINFHGLEYKKLSSLQTCLLRKDGSKEGEIIHHNEGTIIRLPEGIWHTKLKAFI